MTVEKVCFKRWIAALLLGLGAVAMAQEPTSWKQSKDDDPLHGKMHDKFILSGKYLTPPRAVSQGFEPSIVVSCYEGKVEQNYISVGAVVVKNTQTSLYPVRIEARLDDKKTSLLGDHISTDGLAVFFTRVDLRNILKAHRVILGVNEYLGPEVVMQFDMPDAAPVLDKCGKDRILKAK